MTPLRDTTNTVLSSSLSILSEDKYSHMKSVDAIIDLMDNLMYAGEWEEVKFVLDSICTDKYPPTVLTGVLGFSKSAKEELGESRTNFLSRAMKSLLHTWGCTEDRVAYTENRLR